MVRLQPSLRFMSVRAHAMGEHVDLVIRRWTKYGYDRRYVLAKPESMVTCSVLAELTSLGGADSAPLDGCGGTVIPVHGA